MRHRGILALTWLLTALFGSGLGSHLLAAGPARLIEDIQTYPVIGDSYPSGFVNVGDTVYFVASNRASGYALWKTDGTGGGTVKVKDLYLIRDLTPVGSTIFFMSADLERGWVLWKTDGSTAGTVPVKDIHPSASLDNTGIATGQAALNGILMFLVDDGVHGMELWRSDGTEAGTTLVKDIQPGPAGSTLDQLHSVVFENRLYFPVCASTCQIWQSDGTEAGTVPWTPPGQLFIPNGVQVAGNRLFFSTYLGGTGWLLGVTDGTFAGTYNVFGGTSFSFLAEVNGLLLFAGSDGVHGREIWRTDGTPDETAIVKDIRPGSEDSVFFPEAVVVGGTVFLGADDGVHGTELWRSDGTEAGTALAKDILPGPDSSSPTPLTALAGRLLFYAYGGDQGVELWRSDGTDAGTAMIQDVNPGPGGSIGLTGPAPEPIHGAVILPLNDGTHGTELWRTDGTSAGTVLVKDIDPFVGTQGSGPVGLTPVGDSILMSLAGPPGNFGPGNVVRSDGTEEGTFMLGDVIANLAAASTNAGGLVYFFGYDPAHGFELWRSDGSEAGTYLAKDACPGPASCVDRRGVALGDRYFFPYSDPDHGAEPWISDGSEAGTYLVKDLLPGTASSRPLALGAGALAFFSAPVVTGGTSLLWTSDGTEGGTSPIGDVPVRVNSQRTNHLMVGGKLFFVGSDAAHGNELWESDGSAAGTHVLKDLTPGSGSSTIERFTGVAGALYFFRNLPGPSAELWKSDGTEAGTALVMDLGMVGADESVAIGSLLYFTTERRTGPFGVDLWRSDGTATGTRKIRENELTAATTSFGSPSLGAVDGVLLFSADDGVNGYELWRSDGTDAGTFLVQDIAPGEDSSVPHGFTMAGGRVFFAADDIVHGLELWGGRAAVVTAQPRLAIQHLAEELHALGLPRGIETSLGTKLDAAAEALDGGARRAAAGSLGAFSRELEARSGRTISAQDADQLLEFAGEILALLDSARAQTARSGKPSASAHQPATPTGKAQEPVRRISR